MNMMVTADDNWAIGYRGMPVASIPMDMKFFREETAGKVVVMGRKAVDTLPGRRPMAGRHNIVLSRNSKLKVKDAYVISSLEALLEELKKYPSEDIYVIGGESVYRSLLPYCDLVHVTKLHHAYQADAFFPDLDRAADWELTGDTEEMTYFDIEFQFLRYERVK